LPTTWPNAAKYSPRPEPFDTISYNAGLPCPPPTARLSFRELTDADVDNLQLIFADPIALRHYPSTKDIAETQQWIDWSRQNYQRCGHGLWAVHLRSTDEFIGQCGLIPQNIRDQQEIEIGYLFRRSHWGHGFATEAAAACRDFGFSNIRIEKLVSFIDPANEPSQRVAKRIGMTLEKLLRPQENRWQKEVCVYSINRPH
jgi:RimJ/RimL family protein N-acetyltransferase